MDDIHNDHDLERENEEFRQAESEHSEAAYSDSVQQDEQHFDIHRDDRSDNLDISFEKDVDRLLKVKAKIMFNLNKERQLDSLPPLNQDITLSTIAMKYASSLKVSPPNQQYLKLLCSKEHCDMDFKICELVSDYEEDVAINKAYTQKFFIETGYLFFEMDRDKEILMDYNNTHIGIGIAGNQTTVAVVMLINQRELAITSIEQTSPGNVQVRGKMLETTAGICGVKVYDSEMQRICFVLYDMIDFNRLTKEFCVFLELETNWKEKGWIQLLVRENPAAINYRKPRKDKSKDQSYSKYLKKALMSLFVEYPDPQYVQYYNQEVENQQVGDKNVSSLLLQGIHKETQHDIETQKQEEIVQEEPEHEESENSSEESQNEEQAIKEQMTSNKQIKQELTMAIGQARSTHESLLDTNKMLQAKIKQLREKSHIYLDKTAETSMNEHKYLNILAQVHQTRVQLQQTEQRYNKMAVQLQNKLSQKQGKCNEIRNAFLELKREVAKKATYSRSDQPIKEPTIKRWEEKESSVTEELQGLRLEILKARNTLAKNQKILKKKQQLAEGLHLIDFEQLKIENQTLNERIQERNQDLHKLKKKTTTMVQILTHTREKLKFVEKNRSDLKEEVDGLEQQVQQLRGQINSTKENCQKLRLEIQDAKQETEIVNSQELVVDFKKRAQNIRKLEAQIQGMFEREKLMKETIDTYHKKMKKQILTK